VELLLQNGAQPGFEDEFGQTPLARAVENGSVAIVQLLLAQGVEVNYNYHNVSESNCICMCFPKLMADTVILDHCRK
jgi:ankyrin repeat protein